MGDSRQKLLLIGNSHSKDLYNVFLESTDVTARYQVARFGVQLRELVKNNREPGLFNSPNYMQADIVMIVSRYSSEDSAAMGDIVKRMKSDGKRVAIVKGIYEFYAYGIRNTADGLLQTKYLEQYKKGEITGAEVARLIDGAHYEQYSTRERIKQNLLSDDVIEAIGREHGDVLILDRMDYACNKLEKRCFSLSEKFNKYYYDYGHHSMWGVTFFANRIDQLGWLDDL